MRPLCWSPQRRLTPKYIITKTAFGVDKTAQCVHNPVHNVHLQIQTLPVLVYDGDSIATEDAAVEDIVSRNYLQRTHIDIPFLCSLL